MANTDMLNIDLSNYRDRVGARVEEGRYTVVVEDAEMDQSAKGNPMVNLWLTVVQPEEFAGSTIVDRLTITDRALFRVVGFMQAIGLPTPKKKLQVRVASFIGKTLDIDVQDGEPYNGRVKSEVRGYMRSSVAAGAAGGRPEAQDLDDLVAAESSPQQQVLAGIEETNESDPALDLDAEIDLEKIDL